MVPTERPKRDTDNDISRAYSIICDGRTAGAYRQRSMRKIAPAAPSTPEVSLSPFPRRRRPRRQGPP